MGGGRVVIVGFSTRALAEAARADGWRCWSVDAFGDLDQKARVTNVGMVRDFGRRYTPEAAVSAAARLPAAAAAYVGNLENHPRAVARLARDRELLGNTAETLGAARDLAQLRRVVQRAGGRMPLTLSPGEPRPRGRTFLRKPLRGGGGQGVRTLTDGVALRPGEVAQERIDGVLASASFLADGRRARLLGVARGLAGDTAFGATGFRYCGSLFPLPLAGAVTARLDALAQTLSGAFGLRGLNGIDFILSDDDVFVLELNPRHSASMELIQRAGIAELFELHARACRGSLPADLPRLEPGVWGKAILWARRDLVAPSTRAWLDRDDVRDVPHPGERILRGHPVCTLFGQAGTLSACRTRLVAAAHSLEREFRPVAARVHS